MTPRELAAKSAEDAVRRADPAHLDLSPDSEELDFLEAAENFWHHDGIHDLESREVSLGGGAEDELREVFVARFVALFRERLTAEPSDEWAEVEAELWGDLVLETLEDEGYSDELDPKGEVRSRYLKALREAVGR